jgi:hypothetical protein
MNVNIKETKGKNNGGKKIINKMQKIEIYSHRKV